MQPELLYKEVLASQCKKTPQESLKILKKNKQKKTFGIKMDLTQLNSVITDGDVMLWVCKGVYNEAKGGII